MNIPSKIPNDTVLSRLEFKSKVLARPLTSLNAWVEFCNSRTQQSVKCQLPYWEEVSTNIPCTITKGKVLAHVGFSSKVSTMPSTDLTAWVGFSNSSPQQSIKWQHRYRRGSINISCRIPNGNILAHWWFKSKVLPRPLSVWCDSAPYTHSRVSRNKLNIWEWAPLISRVKFPAAQCLPPVGLN